MATRPRTRFLAFTAIVATLFGILTIFSGGRALFASGDMGSVVPFVLWFNSFAGFLYVAAGLGLWHGATWAPAASAGIAITTGFAFAALVGHVSAGGSYESRTVLAMAFRLSVWSTIAIVAIRSARFAGR